METASLEDMMGNALKAAWCRAVKQCVLKGAAKSKVAKKVKVNCPGAKCCLGCAGGAQQRDNVGGAPSFADAPRNEPRQSHSVPWGVVNHSTSPRVRRKTTGARSK